MPYHKAQVPNNYFNESLTGALGAGVLTVPISNPPGNNSGVLVLEPTSPTKREIIYYTSKDATHVYCPSWGRGLGGTTDQSHESGAVIVDAPTSVHFEGLIYAVNEGFRPTDWSAAHVSSVTINVTGNVVTEAAVGRKVRVNFATSGLKYFVITNASYSAPNTTITLAGETVLNETIDYVDIDLSPIGAVANFNIATIAEYTPSGAGTTTIYPTLHRISRITMPAATQTIALANEAVGQAFIVEIINTTGQGALTWFSTIKWPDGVVPTLTGTNGKKDKFGFVVTGSGAYDGHVIDMNI